MKKRLSECGGNTAAFDLATGPPEGWTWCAIGDVAQVRYGKARPKTEGAIPVIGSSGIYGSAAEPLISFPTLVVGRKGNAGMVWLSETQSWPSDTTFYLDWAGESTELHYLKHCFEKSPLSGEHAKTTLPSLQKADLEEYRFPYPPLPEQRAIAAVLRTVQRAKEACEKMIAATRVLKQSLLHHLFTYGPMRFDQADRVTLKEAQIGLMPEHWHVSRLGDHAIIGNGSTPKRREPRFWEGGTIPWLTSGKVRDSTITYADEFVTPTARKECHLPLVPRGSIVIAITGQDKTLGNSAKLEIDACVSQHLAYISFSSVEILPDYALVFLRSRYEQLQPCRREHQRRSYLRVPEGIRGPITPTSRTARHFHATLRRGHQAGRREEAPSGARQPFSIPLAQSHDWPCAGETFV